MPLEHPKDSRLRVTVATVLALCFATAACESESTRQRKAEERAYQEKYAKAKALFEERCKTAGVVIKRIVKDVEGIELTKVRQPVPWAGKEYFDPMWAEAAMGAEARGHDYINQFLMTESIDKLDPDRRGSLNSPDLDSGPRSLRKRGYRYVEILDLRTQQRSRAELETYPPGTNLWIKAPRFTAITTSTTRYALDYEDLLNAKDRDLWVAGTVLKVIDKNSGEVIAQLTRYIWDSGLGVSTTGRWPWQHAASSGPSQVCPDIPGTSQTLSRRFVDTVLIPKQGN